MKAGLFNFGRRSVAIVVKSMIGAAKVGLGWMKYSLILPLLMILSTGGASEETWQLVDRFKEVSVGEWVKLRYSGGSEHFLLVASKDDKTITLEELVREQGYTTSCTQIVIDLKKKLPILFRERMPRGEIRETEIKEDRSNVNEDFYALLTARFSQQPETRRVVVPAGTFLCKQFYAIFNKKFIRVHVSEKIPLYPVMVVIPNYELVIKLQDFGKGKESRFFTGAKQPPTTSVRNPPEGPAPPATPSPDTERGCSEN